MLPNWTDADRKRARIAHDRLGNAGGDSDACVECFQHQASQEPCPACNVILGEISAARDHCAKLCDEVVRNRRDYGPAERALAKKLAEQMRGAR